MLCLRPLCSPLYEPSGSVRSHAPQIFIALDVQDDVALTTALHAPLRTPDSGQAPGGNSSLSFWPSPAFRVPSSPMLVEVFESQVTLSYVRYNAHPWAAQRRPAAGDKIIKAEAEASRGRNHKHTAGVSFCPRLSPLLSGDRSAAPVLVGENDRKGGPAKEPRKCPPRRRRRMTPRTSGVTTTCRTGARTSAPSSTTTAAGGGDADGDAATGAAGGTAADADAPRRRRRPGLRRGRRRR